MKAALKDVERAAGASHALQLNILRVGDAVSEEIGISNIFQDHSTNLRVGPLDNRLDHHTVGDGWIRTNTLRLMKPPLCL
jgi:hypothetical protein